MVGRDDLLFVDVRHEADLLDDFGHIHGVRSVPEARLLREGIDGVHKGTPVVVVCQNGRQSQGCAAALVRDHDFTEVYHLVGGMLRWNAEERPVARVRTWT